MTRDISVTAASEKFHKIIHRFHVAIGLFSNRSRMMSKCGKNKEVAHELQTRVSLMFLPHFALTSSVIY